MDLSATATVREFMSDDQVTTYPMARSYTGKNRQGLEVCRKPERRQPMVLTDDLFNAVIARARQFYQLALIDCGPHIEHRVMRSVLSQADALVIVGNDGLRWRRRRDHPGLVGCPQQPRTPAIGGGAQ